MAIPTTPTLATVHMRMGMVIRMAIGALTTAVTIRMAIGALTTAVTIRMAIGALTGGYYPYRRAFAYHRPYYRYAAYRRYW